MTQKINKYGYNTPIGKIWITETDNKISRVCFSEPVNGTVKETELLIKTNTQLQEYFNGLRQNFDLPIHLEGTEFQKSVWKALYTIPYGKTASYKEIAEQINKPNAQRAVGMANHNNPIAIIIPCHRVIGSNGRLTGYAGGLQVKEFLLKLEGVI